MKKTLSIFLFFFQFTFIWAQYPGGSAFDFIQIPISAASMAQGGSQVAQWQGDVNQVSDNPAFFDSTLHQAVSLNYLNYVTNINQASAAYARMFDSIGIGSAYLRYFDYGTFQEYDATGIELGKFKAADYEFGVSFARVYNERFTYGVTLKNVFSSMYQYFGYGAGLDFGVHYASESGNFMAGAVLNNVGYEIIDYHGGDLDPLAINLAVGISKKFKRAPLQFGIQLNDLQTWDLAAADGDALQNLEVNELTGESTRRIITLDNFARHLSGSVAFVPGDRLRMMLGYNFRRRLELATPERPALVGFSFGTSIRLKKFSLFYAVSSYHISSASNNFGITTNLNEWVSKKTIEQ